MESRVTQYLHKPIQILWFDSHEMVMIGAMYLFGLIGGTWCWLGLLTLPFLIMFKRKQNRGYFNQLLYFFGFRKFKGYPDPSEEVFYE